MVEFRNSLKNKERYGVDGFKFDGIVTYYAFNTTFTEALEVFLIIGGVEPMVKLDIYERGKTIKPDKFHLDFNPKFSNTQMFFDQNLNLLRIIGEKSVKLGNYELTISEI